MCALFINRQTLRIQTWNAYVHLFRLAANEHRFHPDQLYNVDDESVTFGIFRHTSRYARRSLIEPSTSELHGILSSS